MAVPPILSTVGTHIGVGIGLFLGVHRFFAAVGDVLKEDTRLKIALWLLDAKTAPAVEPWPATFAKVFDRVFGEKHLSWKCFLRSCASSLILATVTATYTFGFQWRAVFLDLHYLLPTFFLAAALPDYISLLESRYVLSIAIRKKSQWLILVVLMLDFICTLYIALAAAFLMGRIGALFSGAGDWADTGGMLGVVVLSPLSTAKLYLSSGVAYAFVPAFFTSIWLWLYAGAGFLLKGARRFDWLVNWMNAHMDIENKPLHSIGLVAGAIMALVYWGVVAVMRWV
jgi:hypothetical protein